MANYAVGDVQGCFDELQLLLEKLKFCQQDTLWLAGDLVNRGPKSLETLRFIKSLGKRARVVLGNHDLHLLAVYFTQARNKKSDTLHEILAADDCEELMHWLRHQPLVQYEKELKVVMTHAGFPLNWKTTKLLSLAAEVSDVLQSENYCQFLKQMYGNTPKLWHKELVGIDRLRCITNYLTRMRFCYSDYSLDFSFKGEIGQQPQELFPWFDMQARAAAVTILFGHWASLMGETEKNNIIALDTGCVWGQRLTAYCIETRQKFHVESLQK